MLRGMKRVAWLSLGLGVLACGSSPKVVSDSFDSGMDRAAVAVDGGSDARPSAKDGGTGDGGVCPASSASYLSEGSYRKTVAWTFVAAASAGVPTTDAGTADDAVSPSRCVASGSAAATGLANYTCRGGAWLRSGAVGPVVTFDDGSTLTWNSTIWDSSSPAPAAPYVTQPAGDRVWVSYRRTSTIICPFCGAYTNTWLEIRDESSTGTVRHYAQQGNHLASPLDIAMAMFGVAVTEKKVCQVHVGGCVSLDRSAFDHRVDTAPAQQIPFATLTSVTSPNGTYDVLWDVTAESGVTYNADAGCGTDLPGISNDDGFVGTRRAP
jgi:hypothetical protein